MQIYESNGRTIQRTPDVMEYLKTAILSDKKISNMLSGVSISPQNWSAGGGLHFAGVHLETQTRAFLKVGVKANEMKWIEEVSQRAPHLCPKLHGQGTRISGCDIGWIITEALPHGTLGPLWKGAEFDLLIDAAVEFQLISRTVNDPTVPEMTLDRLVTEIGKGMRHNPPGPAQEIFELTPVDYDWVVTNSQQEVCHGDLHLCNGLTRVPAPNGPVLLIDFEPIKQPWAMEAAYLQVLCSTDPKRPGFRGLVQKMAMARERRRMTTCTDIEKLSRIVLAWSSICRWGVNLDRHAIPEYRKQVASYIEAAQSGAPDARAGAGHL